MNLNPDTLSEIKTAFSSALSDQDKEKYASIGSQFYNMMNFENLEQPIDTKSLLYTMNIIAKDQPDIQRYIDFIEQLLSESKEKAKIEVLEKVLEKKTNYEMEREGIS